MTITKITFQQTFPTGPYMNQKLGVEIEVPDFHPSTGESNWDKAMDCFKEAKKLVNDAFHAMNREEPVIKDDRDYHLNGQPFIHPTYNGQRPIPEINLEKERVEILIDNAETVEELVGYKKDADKYGLFAEYISKYEQLNPSK